MKTLQTITRFFLLTAVFAFASCNKDDDNDAAPVIPPAAGDYFMNAKVNGSDYSNSAYFAPSATINAGVLQVQSSNDGGNSIQLQVQNYVGVGAYNTGGNLTNGYVNYMTIMPFKTYTSVRGTGSVEITEVTETYIKGTFTAVAPENQESPSSEVAITEGTFKAKF